MSPNEFLRALRLRAYGHRFVAHAFDVSCREYKYKYICFAAGWVLLPLILFEHAPNRQRSGRGRRLLFPYFHEGNQIIKYNYAL